MLSSVMNSSFSEKKGSGISRNSTIPKQALQSVCSERVSITKSYKPEPIRSRAVTLRNSSVSNWMKSSKSLSIYHKVIDLNNNDDLEVHLLY